MMSDVDDNDSISFIEGKGKKWHTQTACLRYVRSSTPWIDSVKCYAVQRLRQRRRRPASKQHCTGAWRLPCTQRSTPPRDRGRDTAIPKCRATHCDICKHDASPE